MKADADIAGEKPGDMPEEQAGAPGGRIRQATMAHILAAAEQVFAEAGYAGASMSRLARAAGLPKPNLHYYFGSKQALYTAVLQNILTLWLDAADDILPERDPAEALTAYISAKMAHSRGRPHASKVFANEVLRGAPELHSYLGLELRRIVDEKALVLEGWAKRGLMDPVDARHLFFAMWAMTQTYADFDVQIRAVLGVRELDDAAFETARLMVTRLVLRGCGVTTKEAACP
jgi:TetR/AcrR family transcriptional regulator